MSLTDPVRRCRRCRTDIRDPGTTSISTYAAFWRDNRCPRCGGQLQSVDPLTKIAYRGQPQVGRERERREQEEERRERARRLLQAAAQAHRRRLATLEGTLAQSLDTSTIQLADVDCMTGIEFEEFVAALFSGPGRTVEKTKASGDQGGDLVVRQGIQREVVQAKRSLGAVSNAAVQEVVAAKAVYGCQSAWVVTNASFTGGAEQLAQANHVELVDRERLQLLLKSVHPPERRG